MSFDGEIIQQKYANTVRLLKGSEVRSPNVSNFTEVYSGFSISTSHGWDTGYPQHYIRWYPGTMRTQHGVFAIVQQHLPHGSLFLYSRLQWSPLFYLVAVHHLNAFIFQRVDPKVSVQLSGVCYLSRHLTCSSRFSLRHL